jgi:hypothetical protein
LGPDKSIEPTPIVKGYVPLGIMALGEVDEFGGGNRAV